MSTLITTNIRTRTRSRDSGPRIRYRVYLSTSHPDRIGFFFIDIDNTITMILFFRGRAILIHTDLVPRGRIARPSRTESRKFNRKSYKSRYKTKNTRV